MTPNFVVQNFRGYHYLGSFLYKNLGLCEKKYAIYHGLLLYSLFFMRANKHGIAETKEAIFFIYGMLVRIEYILFTSKGAD